MVGLPPGTNGWMHSASRGIRNKYEDGAPVQPVRATGLGKGGRIPAAAATSPRPRQTTGYSAQRYPSFFMNAAAGRKVGDISGSMASMLAPMIAGRVTVYLIQLGINDATALVPAATFIPQVTAVRDAILAAPGFRMLIWLFTGFAGEKYPDGANTWDTVADGILDKDTQIAGLIAPVTGCYYISGRSMRLVAENATTNPGNDSSGRYTVDGVHFTTTPTPGLVSGESLLTDYTLSQFSFA